MKNKFYRYFILTLFLILAGGAAFLTTKVKVNYDLTKYLPKDSETKLALEMLENEFGNKAVVQLMIEEASIADALKFKETIQEIEGIENVKWLDDAFDLSLPKEMIPDELKARFYHEGNALLYLSFQGDDYDLEVEKAIDLIREKLKDEKISFRGEALHIIEARAIASDEVFEILLIIIPVIILILFLAAKSWFEPIIILFVLGIAVLLNLGTNIFITDISYITQTMVMALQLAISLDFSLFLVHRYYEERKKGEDVMEATIKATKATFKTITASALTTIMGFLALTFMSYRIGIDIGIVLGKGVLFSYLSVIILMPVVIIISSPLLDKTHRGFIPKLGGLSKILYGGRIFIIGFFLLLSITFFQIQSKAKFNYGSQALSDENSQVTLEKQKISKEFGSYNPIVILVKNGNPEDELKLVQDLMMDERIISVESLVTVAPEIPREFLPDEIKRLYIGPNYTRFILNTVIEKEGEEMFAMVDFLRLTTKKHYLDYYLIGNASSTAEIKDTTEKDSLLVNVLSAAAVGFIILIIFRSISIPLLLLLIIETSIWINIGILKLQDIRITYIGYLVILALQLGATIDYAVLLTGRYLEARKEKEPREAIRLSLNSSSNSLLISSLVLAIAGYGISIISDIKEVHDIGLLIGRGAILSASLVILVLPVFLLLLDKVIMKTTIRK
jgi:hypothetical protein